MTTAKKPIIELRNVWKIYQIGDVKVEALRGLNWKVYPGEFVAIQGPSGSGKSTAMNMVGCLDIPSKGQIFLDGQDISHLEESDLAQIRGKKIGFIFQKFNLINTLSAAENVMLPLMFLDVPEDERKKIRENRIGKKIKTKAIYTYKAGELTNSVDGERRKVPFNEFPISFDLAVFAGKVRIANLGSRVSGIIIEDPEIAKSMEALLDLAWEAAEKYNHKKRAR